MSRPGRLAERIGAAGFESTFRETLLRSCPPLQDTGHSSAAAAVEVVGQNAEKLAPLVQEIALAALTDGELRSGLVRLEGLLVYVLVFPGQHDDRRTFRGDQSLAHGWPAHAQAVMSAADRDRSKAVPMLSLLFFLRLDAQSGTLLVAYDGDEGSLYPVELADPADRSIPCSGVAGLSQEFVVA
jgi:hypothetical protein